VECIPYFVDPAFCAQEHFAVRTPAIVFLGLLNDHRKGLDLLIEAMAVLARRKIRLRLDVIGEGAMRSVFEKLAEARGIEATFHGRLPVEGNRSLLSEATAFCMPSRSESFGITYLEALACGTPVVGFAPTIQELQNDYSTYIGEPFDAAKESVEDLAEKLEEVVSAFRVRESQTLRSQIRFETIKRFSLARYQERYREVYRKLLAS
jgi:glycosyltransferase involved in cell wall biosynthesis